MPTEDVTKCLADALRDAAPRALCVAFSGGPDSTALLHALAHVPTSRRYGLRALHIDHGLRPESLAWAEHCTQFCASLGVPITVVRTQVHDTRREGIEAAARRARYAAFAQHLRAGEWLALAHHRDDQVETVLLKLLRGAGPEGLAGMHEARPFARGKLWRPLLGISRQTLHDYVRDQALPSVDDPANHDPRFTRNALRQEILPQIARRWPRADASILHAARLCREVADYVNQAAATALTALYRDRCTLDAHGWLALPDALRAAVLDSWLRARALPPPPDAPRAELERQARCAAADRVPLITWPGAEVRIWDRRLHASSTLAPPPQSWQVEWCGGPLTLPDGCGWLSLDPADDLAKDLAACCEAPLIVRFRRGGESIAPADDTHTRDLRDLFQRSRMPPWVRARCPLIFWRGELVAVADLWCNVAGQRLFTSLGGRPRWERPAFAR